MDVDLLVALDIDQGQRVVDAHPMAVAAGDSLRKCTLGHTVVEKHVTVVGPRACQPLEEQLRHAAAGLNAVTEKVFHRLVAASLKRPLPAAFDGGFGRRDDEIHVHRIDIFGISVVQHPPYPLGSEAVEAEAVHQQVRDGADPVGLVADVAIELAVDHHQLAAGQVAGILLRRSQRLVVEQLAAPDVGADRRVTVGIDALLLHNLFQHRPQRALAGRRGALEADQHRLFTRGNTGVALAFDRRIDHGRDHFADHLAALPVAKMPHHQHRQQVLVGTEAAALAGNGAEHPVEAAKRRTPQRIGGGEAHRLVVGDYPMLAVGGRLRLRRFLRPPAAEPAARRCRRRRLEQGFGQDPAHHDFGIPG